MLQNKQVERPKKKHDNLPVSHLLVMAGLDPVIHDDV
jgi:hypothetical protein